MSKRFHDTEIWDEDWFIALPRDYRDFYLFIKDKCDHAGIYRPNIAKFNKLYDCEVSGKKAVELINNGKERIVVLPNGRWLIPDFICFQYGDHLNPNNRVHASILKVLETNEVNLSSIRGLIDPLLLIGVKDKDKDNNSNKGVVKGEKPTTPQQYFYIKYKEIFSNDYVANFGKDGAIFKDLGKVMDDKAQIALIDKFFESEDEFIKKSGYTIGVFKSQINKLQAKKSSLITFKE